MSVIRFASRVVSQNEKGQDRVKIVGHETDSSSVVLADGAGGVSGGERAAEISVEILTQIHPIDHGVLFDTILNLDYQLKTDLKAGLTTAVCVYTTGIEFIGAVVG